MVLSFRFLRMPRPTHFLGFFDLQNGAELILMSALLNKVSGIYGILATFTGAEISALQLSMFIYSIILAITLIALTPSLHKRDPLAALSFAYLYVIDSLINALYTLVFGISWFLVLSSKHHPAAGVLGNAGMTYTGFTSPAYNTSDTDAAASGQGTAAAGINTEGAGTSPSFLPEGVLQPESATSILIISILWVIRSYFILIILAFARSVVRESATPGEEPFTGRNYGDGWKDRLGRVLVRISKINLQGADGWERFGSKFRRSEEDRRINGSRRSSLPPV